MDYLVIYLVWILNEAILNISIITGKIDIDQDIFCLLYTSDAADE